MNELDVFSRILLRLMTLEGAKEVIDEELALERKKEEMKKHE